MAPGREGPLAISTGGRVVRERPFAYRQDQYQPGRIMDVQAELRRAIEETQREARRRSQNSRRNHVVTPLLGYGPEEIDEL